MLLHRVLPLLLLLSCSALPSDVDVERVKETFLALRFQSAATDENQGLPDRELFEQACRRVGVRCNHVLQKLKEKDPEFYRRLEMP
ncbi:MAG: hypothetical protein HS115_04805 [Spirochaetales bacterium]|nr:hypothetical protein [Spirochaetales bacterium]